MEPSFRARDRFTAKLHQQQLTGPKLREGEETGDIVAVEQVMGLRGLHLQVMGFIPCCWDSQTCDTSERRKGPQGRSRSCC